MDHFSHDLFCFGARASGHVDELGLSKIKTISHQANIVSSVLQDAFELSSRTAPGQEKYCTSGTMSFGVGTAAAREMTAMATIIARKTCEHKSSSSHAVGGCFSPCLWGVWWSVLKAGSQTGCFNPYLSLLMPVRSGCHFFRRSGCHFFRSGCHFFKLSLNHGRIAAGTPQRSND